MGVTEFDTERLREMLAVSRERRIIVFDRTDSTNARLACDLSNGLCGLHDIYIANSQSAGRGRRGKSFISNYGGLYMSFCVEKDDSGLMTVICGVAVADALSKMGFSPEIKWVNDILINNKKVCGILAQSSSDSNLAVMGVGINLAASALTGEVSDIATALECERGVLMPRERIAAEVVNGYGRLVKEKTEDVIEKYKSYMTMLGGEVIIKETGERCRAVDVDITGALTVSFPRGEIRRLNSGEISVIKSD